MNDTSSSVKRIPFTKADEQTIIEMAKWMRISAVAMVVAAVAGVLAAALAHQFGNVISAIIAVVVAKWLWGAADAFEKVAKTDDDDQRFLAEGIVSLKNIFLLKAILFIVGICLAILAVVGAFLIAIVVAGATH